MRGKTLKISGPKSKTTQSPSVFVSSHVRRYKQRIIAQTLIYFQFLGFKHVETKLFGRQIISFSFIGALKTMAHSPTAQVLRWYVI